MQTFGYLDAVAHQPVGPLQLQLAGRVGNAGQQFIRTKRFAQIIDGAPTHGGGCFDHRGGAADHDHRHVQAALDRKIQYRRAPDSRHPQVQHQQVVAILGQLRQGRRAADGHRNHITMGFKQPFETGQKTEFIVHDENRKRLVRFLFTTIGALQQLNQSSTPGASVGACVGTGSYLATKSELVLIFFTAHNHRRAINGRTNSQN